MFKRMSQALVIFLMISFPFILRTEEADKHKSESKETPDKTACKDVKEELSETRHEVVINGQVVAYKALAGNIILKDDKCEPKATIFYISYTKEGVDDLKQRPITFCFNGGPGSSSAWLHVGVFGPRRVSLTERGDALPPYCLIDNAYSILDVTDLVFIDPVSTGYSRAIPVEEAKHFHGVEEDIKSIAEFIRLYTTRFNRWESPKFLAGESYGTTRAAGLAGYLHDKYYMYMNGILLVSSVLNFQSIDFTDGNDLPYLLFLPSYTAAAWYHKRLEPELQNDLMRTLQEAENFVINEYSLALFKGNMLSVREKQNIIEKLARYTALSPEYIDRSNLRIDIMRFVKELLRNQKRTIGRFDSRFEGIDANAAGEYFDYDPSADAIFGAFTATLNYYLHSELKWKQDNHYKILTNVQPWDYGIATNQYLNVAETLRGVMTKNPHMRVFVANGYYDLATPYFATEYTFSHLNLDPSLADHVSMSYYDAGHMMYIHRPSLIKLKQDLANFYRRTLDIQAQEETANLSVQR
jgi:carboxypeptidase C (cathepsin A)